MVRSCGLRLHHSRLVANPEEARRSGEDKPPGCHLFERVGRRRRALSDRLRHY